MGCWKSVNNNWHKCRNLSRLERLLLIQALFLLPLTVIALRLFSLKRLHTTLSRLTFSAGKIIESEQHLLPKAYSTARMVQIARRHGIARANCLQQSIVLWWLLRRQCIESDLRIGVRKEVDRFEAHAWVECQGIVLNDMDDVHQRFAPFSRAIIPVEVRSS